MGAMLAMTTLDAYSEIPWQAIYGLRNIKGNCRFIPIVSTTHSNSFYGGIGTIRMECSDYLNDTKKLSGRGIGHFLLLDKRLLLHNKWLLLENKYRLFGNTPRVFGITPGVLKTAVGDDFVSHQSPTIIISFK